MNQEAYYVEKHAYALLADDEEQARLIEDRLADVPGLDAFFALNRLLRRVLRPQPVDEKFRRRLHKQLLKAARQRQAQATTSTPGRPFWRRYWVWGALAASVASIAGSLAFLLFWRRSSGSVAS